MTLLSSFGMKPGTNAAKKKNPGGGGGGGIGAALGAGAQGALDKLNPGYTQIDPPPGGVDYTGGYNQPTTDTSPDLASQLNDFLAGLTSAIQGPDTSKTDAMNNYLRDMALSQQQAQIQDQMKATNDIGNITFPGLQRKSDFEKANYQTQLGDLARQYNSNLFNTNINATASGAYGSYGANLSRKNLGEAYTSQTGTLGRSQDYNQALIQDAIKRAYVSIMGKSADLQRAQDYTNTEVFLRGLNGL